MKIKKLILDTLFPISCLSCGTYGVWICNECLKKIEIISSQVCPYCEKEELPAGKFCRKCHLRFIKNNENAPLDNLITATKYNSNNLAKLVHTFKYSFVKDLSLPLSNLILRAVLDNHLPLPDYIIPIPLHPRRIRWRGFNQAELLAENLSFNLSPGLTIPILTDLIIRQKFTPPQMHIKCYQERKKNLRGAFALKHSNYLDHIKNKKILLIDDISTTGSTLFECSKVLKNAKVKKIYAAVIARQEVT